MRTSTWGKTLAVIALLGLMVATGGAAAPDHNGLTWDELKAVQATERAEMMKAQSEEWQGLLAAQEKESSPTEVSSTQSELDALEKLHEQKATERKEIARTFAEERAALAKTHAQEREAFFNGSHAEKPAAQTGEGR